MRCASMAWMVTSGQVSTVRVPYTYTSGSEQREREQHGNGMGTQHGAPPRRPACECTMERLPSERQALARVAVLLILLHSVHIPLHGPTADHRHPRRRGGPGPRLAARVALAFRDRKRVA